MYIYIVCVVLIKNDIFRNLEPMPLLYLVHSKCGSYRAYACALPTTPSYLPEYVQIEDGILVGSYLKIAK